METDTLQTVLIRLGSWRVKKYFNLDSLTSVWSCDAAKAAPLQHH